MTLTRRSEVWQHLGRSRSTVSGMTSSARAGSVIFRKEKGTLFAMIPFKFVQCSRRFQSSRYINTDYVLFSSLKNTKCNRVCGSYDVACQYMKNIHIREQLLPEDLRYSKNIKKLTFFIPKFHIPAHEENCNLEFSFNLTRGVGRTDGEAPERGWANINPLASSTKEMGPGSRRDTLDDHFNDWNWKKITKLGKSIHYMLDSIKLTDN